VAELSAALCTQPHLLACSALPSWPPCPALQKASMCAAKHAATARLCACVPPKEDSRRRLHSVGPGAGSYAAAAAAAQQRRQQQQQQQSGADALLGSGQSTSRLRLL